MGIGNIIAGCIFGSIILDEESDTASKIISAIILAGIIKDEVEENED